MNNSIYELVKSHLCIIDKKLQDVKLPLWTNEKWQILYENWLFQLDFLSWYVWEKPLTLYGVPWCISQNWDLENGYSWIKDNPNRIPTEYENVYMKKEYFWENIAIDYQLVIPWKSPVAIMNWRYFKVRQWKEYNYRWRVCIYWKALKLYYMWYIQRLKKYILQYNWECCRADLCWDFPCKIPEWIIDLKLSWTNHETRYYWEKNSPIFFRTYDKTQDLRREKNCFSWFYPERYTKECRRLECQITWKYSRSMTPLDWLDVVKVDKSKIQKIESTKRNTYKTLLFSAIDTIDWINISLDEKIEILKSVKKLSENKINKLLKNVL